jgi:hypothetical protein
MGLEREPYGFLDAYFRHQRAGEHLSDLRKLIQAFKADPQEIGTDIKAETLDELFSPRLTEVRQVAIPDEIPIRVGEFAYNLRCALDYLVFALAWHDTGIEPTGDWAKRLQFPIESRPKLFETRRTTLLKGLSDPHVAMIREYQPCEGCDWTRVLADLNDSDKHRYLTVLAGSFDPETDTSWWVVNAAEIEAMWGRGLTHEKEDMEMELRATLDVVFPDGSLVSETLEELESEVGALLLRFGREFTLRPV